MEASERACNILTNMSWNPRDFKGKHLPKVGEMSENFGEGYGNYVIQMVN